MTESYVVMSQTTTARRGLFGRLRSRGTTMMTPVAMVPTPPPMPAPGTTITTPTTTTPTTGVIPASGTIVTTDGSVITTDGSVITTADYTTPVQTRRGLFGRLRNR
jgi:hypothetical protein